MPMFSVKYSETWVGCYNIEAPTAEEAEKKFNDIVARDGVDYDSMKVYNDINVSESHSCEK